MEKRFVKFKRKIHLRYSKRYRESDERVTRYYLIPDLKYMFFKVIDRSLDEYQKLELKELLSFG